MSLKWPIYEDIDAVGQYSFAMGFLGSLVQLFAPIFLMCSPVTSYADQIIAMHRNRNSAGFSLDIPLIMLTASLLKIFYWPGARYDYSLLIQALTMVVVQMILLKVVLDNRSGWRGGADSLPFANTRDSSRPWDFWRWKHQRMYWQFLMLFTLGLTVLQVLIAPSPANAFGYTTLLGTLGLTIEALLPLPQLHSNWQAQSCKGFRLSVLVNWLIGDALKLGFFFMSDAGKVPWAFKFCATFQALCDVGLGAQYYMYGERQDTEKDIRMT